MCVQKTLHLLLIFMVLTYLSMLENVCGSNPTTKINYKKLTHIKSKRISTQIELKLHVGSKQDA